VPAQSLQCALVSARWDRVLLPGRDHNGMLMSRSTRRFIVRPSVNRYDVQITATHDDIILLAARKTLASRHHSSRRPFRTAYKPYADQYGKPTATEAPVAAPTKSRAAS